MVHLRGPTTWQNNLVQRPNELEVLQDVTGRLEGAGIVSSNALSTALTDSAVGNALAISGSSVTTRLPAR